MSKRKTRDENIADFVKVHGNKYDYSKFDTQNTHEKGTIICHKIGNDGKEHGEFQMDANKHADGHGCPECARETISLKNRKTGKEHIIDFKRIYGDTYDYSLFECNNVNDKGIIICHKIGPDGMEHGIFKRSAHSHKSGQGCPKCKKETNVINKLNNKKENYIKSFIATHGDKYDYSLIKYAKNVKKVCIVCHNKDIHGNEHGEFWLTPSQHIAGYGCPACKEEEFNKNNINKFIKVHGDKYDYSLFNTKKMSEKGKIVCHVTDENGVEHGVFEMSANNHINGHGCLKCANEHKSKTMVKTKEKFIDDARKIHGNKYIYTNVNYVNEYTKVLITCPIHGDFPQRPHNHLQGDGCPYCQKSILEIKTVSTLEKHKISFEPQKKFPWLRNKREMPLDFYLTDYNAAIECQGEQHYHSTGGYFDDNAVNEIKQRDKLKHKLCQEHGIPIYYINYNDNVEEKVTKLIETLKNNNILQLLTQDIC